MSEEREKNGGLTDEQYSRLKAEILNDIYAEVGRSAISVFLWAGGILLTAILAYFGLTGKIAVKP